MAILLVVLSGLMLAATWIGYPVWLRLRGGSTPRQLSGGPHAWWPSVTIVLVVRNAEHTLHDLLNNLLALAYPADRRRILVVSDASDDFTDAVAALFAHRGVDLLRLTTPHGLAGAGNVARRYLRSDLAVVVDPAARLRPWSLASLVAPFSDRSVGMAYGNEVPADHGRGRKSVETPFRKFESWLRDLETRVFGTVSARGTLYAMRGPLFHAPVDTELNPDFVLTLTAREHGYRAVFVPDAECVVARPSSLKADYVRTRWAVARDARTLLSKPHLLNPLKYGAFAWMLLGHKLFRWMTPFVMLTALAGLALLAVTDPWARTALAGVAVVGVVAAFAALIPARTAFTRAAALPGHVATTIVAIAVACVRALRGPEGQPRRIPNLALSTSQGG